MKRLHDIAWFDVRGYPLWSWFVIGAVIAASITAIVLSLAFNIDQNPDCAPRTYWEGPDCD